MVPIEYALREVFFPALFGGEEVSANPREIIGHSVKHGGLGITDPRLMSERMYNNPKAASEFLVGSLLGDNNFNYIGHKGCVCRERADKQKQREFLDTVALERGK